MKFGCLQGSKRAVEDEYDEYYEEINSPVAATV